MLELTSKDAVRLSELERVIESGLSTFQAVGRALMTIRDERLYKPTHKTFELYCRERWKMGRSYACRLIQACQIGQDLLPNGQQNGDPPNNERQARKVIDSARIAELKRKALASLPPAERDEVIAEQENQLKRNSMPHVHGGQGRKERLNQIERVGKRWRGLVEGLGDEADPILKKFDSIMDLIRGLPE
jgi:hypothetical protein